MKDIYKQTGIYRITNKVNGKTYVGKTGMNFGDRWDSHRSLLNNNKHDNPLLQRAWNKYGCDSFEFNVIVTENDPDALNSLERQHIAEYRDKGLSYNLHDGGDGGYNLGKHLSEETKRKIGDKNRINMTGRKASQETREKMSQSQLRRYSNWTDEQREAHGLLTSRTARGYKWSPESRAALSKSQREKPHAAKFTPNDIRNIRRRKASGDTLKQLATDYNTSESYVSNIVHFRRWADIV